MYDRRNNWNSLSYHWNSSKNSSQTRNDWNEIQQEFISIDPLFINSTILVFFWAIRLILRPDCYTFQIASFYRNPDQRKSNLLGSRFVLESAWKRGLKRIVVKKNKTNWSGISSNISFIMLTQHYAFFWDWKRSNPGSTIRIKQIAQKNTRNKSILSLHSLVDFTLSYINLLQGQLSVL